MPLAGAVFLGWNVGIILFLFWGESLIIGFYNVLKLVAFGTVEGIATAAFFVVHYGVFMVVHLAFLWVFFLVEATTPMGALRETWLAWALLMLSHGFSFVYHYVMGGERKTATVQGLMRSPYSRILIMHVTIIFAGVPVLFLGSPVLGVALLVALKIVVDVRAHVKEHGEKAPSNAGAPAATLES